MKLGYIIYLPYSVFSLRVPRASLVRTMQLATRNLRVFHWQLYSTVIGSVLELNADTHADGIRNHLARSIHKVDVATPSSCPS